MPRSTHHLHLCVTTNLCSKLLPAYRDRRDGSILSIDSQADFIRLEVVTLTGTPRIASDVRLLVSRSMLVFCNSSLFVDAGLDTSKNLWCRVRNRLWSRFGSAVHKGFVSIAACVLGEVDHGLRYRQFRARTFLARITPLTLRFFMPSATMRHLRVSISALSRSTSASALMTAWSKTSS